MREDHAKRVRDNIRELGERFAEAVGVPEDARKIWLKILFVADSAIAEAAGARIEADTLATELQLYRPTRDRQTAAPLIDGICYVFTGKAWVCAAAEHRKTVVHQACYGAYSQEHYVPDRKTVCGQKTAYPVNERFASGGWPRLRELCPDCVRLLLDAGRFPADAVKKSE